jgi:ATP/maltotriose-dependent transcriptional regulator MalT
VVFDNFHEARTPSAQRAALAQGLEEIPEGSTVIVLSRSDPPPEFARLIASRRIAQIDETALRCTPDEAEAILGSKHAERTDLQRIQRQSRLGGRAAAARAPEPRHATLDESGRRQDAIFQYFAGEIFTARLRTSASSC